MEKENGERGEMISSMLILLPRVSIKEENAIDETDTWLQGILLNI